MQRGKTTALARTDGFINPARPASDCLTLTDGTRPSCHGQDRRTVAASERPSAPFPAVPPEEKVRKERVRPRGKRTPPHPPIGESRGSPGANVPYARRGWRA